MPPRQAPWRAWRSFSGSGTPQVVFMQAFSACAAFWPHDGRPEREELARRGLGAGEGPAGDDAGADDVLRMGDLDLPRHVGAGGEPRDRGGVEVGAELGQRLRPRRRPRGDRERRRRRARRSARSACGASTEPRRTSPHPLTPRRRAAAWPLRSERCGTFLGHSASWAKNLLHRSTHGCK